MTSPFATLDVEDTEDFLGPEPDSIDEQLAAETPDEPDAGFIDKPERSRTAKQWEKRARKSLGTITRLLLSRPATVADGAVMMYHGPKVAEAWGDLAADNAKVAKAIEMLESGTDSPIVAMSVALAPLLLQIARNHEPELEPRPRIVRIGKFNVKIPLPKVGIKLGVLRPITNDPNELIRATFANPKLRESLERNGISVAKPRNWTD